MSDYLSRVVDRASPPALPVIRPRLQSRFEGLAQPAFTNMEQEMTPPATERAFVNTEHAAATPTAAQASARPEQAVPQPRASQGMLPPAHTHVTVPTPAPSLLHIKHVNVLHTPAAPQLATTPGVRPVITEVIATKPLLASAEPVQNEQSVIVEREAPLLGSPTAPTPVSLPLAPVSASPAQSTVNISIGRLEIRAAVPGPERLRAAPPAARGPLGLDAYLRGKSRRPKS